MTLTDFCDPRAMETARTLRPWRRATMLASGLVACAMSVFAPPALAQADAWPTQTLKLIVPFPPGGAADIIGRHYAEQLSHALERLNREIAVIAQSQKTAQHFAQNGITVEQSSLAAFAKLIRDDHARWGHVIRVGEVKLD
jgi:tripartite-type tricarboxylate transporter receptor subunit TctC